MIFISFFRDKGENAKSKYYKMFHFLIIETADGIIIGSPTYASNISGQMKVIIDRGHFVIEQLLFGKYAISVSTYENYGGKDTAKILNRLFCYHFNPLNVLVCILPVFLAVSSYLGQ